MAPSGVPDQEYKAAAVVLKRLDIKLNSILMAKTADSDLVGEGMSVEYYYTWPTEHDLPATYPTIQLAKK